MKERDFQVLRQLWPKYQFVKLAIFVYRRHATISYFFTIDIYTFLLSTSLLKRDVT